MRRKYILNISTVYKFINIYLSILIKSILNILFQQLKKLSKLCYLFLITSFIINS